MLPPPPPLPHARAWQAGVGLPAQLHPPPHPLTPPCSPPALLPSPPPPPTPTTQPPMPPPPPPPPPRPRCLVHAAGELGGGGKDGRGAKGAKRPCRPPAPCARDNSHTAARSPVGVTHAPAPARGGGTGRPSGGAGVVGCEGNGGERGRPRGGRGGCARTAAVGTSLASWRERSGERRGWQRGWGGGSGPTSRRSCVRHTHRRGPDKKRTAATSVGKKRRLHVANWHLGGPPPDGMGGAGGGCVPETQRGEAGLRSQAPPFHRPPSGTYSSGPHPPVAASGRAVRRLVAADAGDDRQQQGMDARVDGTTTNE